ncbi:TPA: transposase [Vibrio vulnificus]|uniref:Transposase n=1 Tax=Vibrio vulnificus TaxID=672 RepID=A0A8H9K5E6_VIBVL|nr:transposase [Vibrio vulnificus]
MQLAHRIELKPNNTQRTYFAKACGVARFTWNWALFEWQKQYKEFIDGKRDKKPNGKALKKELNAIKKLDFPWMYEVTKYAAQQPFINLDKAYKAFFKGTAHYPRPKKKGKSTDSFYVGGDQVVLKGQTVKVPNLGYVRMKEPLKYGGKINSMTISRQADKWFVSFSIDVEFSPVPTENQGRVGVDLGINALATMSKGEVLKWNTPKPLQSSLKRLKRMSRGLSRKQRGSNGFKRLKQRIARLHMRISNLRKDVLHKLTSYLTSHFSEIVIEDLNVRGMMANKRLARHIADVGMFEIRRQLTYKSEWRGNLLHIADRFFPSSKLCSGCGEKNTGLKLSDRTYKCGCGAKIDRDFNASINLENYPCTVS